MHILERTKTGLDKQSVSLCQRDKNLMIEKMEKNVNGSRNFNIALEFGYIKRNELTITFINIVNYV